MKVDQPNAEEKVWREHVRELGSVISHRSPCEIHHPAGRKGSHNKVKMGHWWILPLTTEEHRLIDRGNAGLQELMDRYMANHLDADWWLFKDKSLHWFEKKLFGDVLKKAKIPISEEIKDAIRGWHR